MGGKEVETESSDVRYLVGRERTTVAGGTWG